MMSLVIARRTARRAVLTMVAGLSVGVVMTGCGDDGSLFQDADDPQVTDVADVTVAEPVVVSIEQAERSGIAVGDVVVLPEDHELVTPHGGEVDGFEQVGDARYQATAAGTYDVVAYEEVPCGGPVGAYPAYSIEVIGAPASSDEAQPAGLVSAPAAVAGRDAIACG